MRPPRNEAADPEPGAAHPREDAVDDGGETGGGLEPEGDLDPRTRGPRTKARLIDAAELAKLATMSIRARVIVEGAFAGLHHNRHAGNSIEFAEHKEYAPGDDIRHIDWKAVARIDRYYVKRFEDETEMRTYLLLDSSASMGYRRAGVSKLDFAAMLCASLAYLLGQQGDPAGLLVFDEKTRNYLPPRNRPGHIRDLMTALDAGFAAGRTDPARALGEVGELAERRSLVLLFTDLLDAPEALPARVRQLRARGHDITVFHVLDADEIELPRAELTHFEGMEPDDGRALLGDPEELRVAFRRESQAFRDRWRHLLGEARVDYHLARTDAPPAEIVRAFLAARQGQRTFRATSVNLAG